MAWQLIYTSAPRSLEAGRSGFGTVARHRALSPLLVSAIERTSQFSRLPGVDTDRVIFSHRVVTVAGSRFHVLSSIRDAGADYTGRTNHIAHHLIVDPREIAQLGAGGPSPADVLLAMPWATSWTEHPRYLEAADEVALATLHARTTGTAWQRITGDPNQAGLLATGDASRGAYIIQPPGVDDLREVFAESLRLMPERLWQISFTTSLQPSDESADFRWIGIEERSPLRAQAESSGRPVLNLASPGTLPIVQVAHPAEVLSVAPLIPSPASEMDVSPSAALHMNEVGKSPVAPPKLRISVRPSMPSHASNEKLVKNTSAGYTSVTKKNTARQLPWLWIAAMAVVFILAGIWHLIVAPYLQAQREEKSERERIVKFVNDAVHFTRPAVNGDKDQDFSKVPLPDLRRLNKLAELTREMISFMKPPEFEKMREAEQAFANESKEAPRSSLPVPPEFDAIRKSLVESISINEELKRIHTSKEGDSAFTDLKTVTKRIEDLDGGSSPHRSALQAKLREIAAAESERVADKEASPLLALLKGNIKPTQALEWYKKEVEAADKRAPALKERLKPVHTLLEDWKFVEEQKIDEAPENLDKRLKERPDWPDWLKRKAQSKKRGTKDTKNDPAAGATNPQSPSVDQLATLSRVPLYFVMGKERLPDCTIAELASKKPNEPAPKLTFFLKQKIGDDGAVLFDVANNDKLRRSRGDADATFVVDQPAKKLSLDKGAQNLALPFGLSAKDVAGNELFHLWVVGQSAEALFGKKTTGLSNNGSKFFIDPAVAPLPGLTSQNLYLETPADFSPSVLQQASNMHKLENSDLSFSLGKITEAVNKNIQEFTIQRNKVIEPTEQSLFDEYTVAAKASLSKDALRRLTSVATNPRHKLCGEMLQAFGDDWKRLGFGKPFPDENAVDGQGQSLRDPQLDNKPPDEVGKVIKNALAFVRGITHRERLTGPEKAKVQKLAALENMIVLAGADPDKAKKLLDDRKQATHKERTGWNDKIKGIDDLLLLKKGIPSGKYLLSVGCTTKDEVGDGAVTKIPLYEFQIPPVPKP